jgi:polyhydroxybutyrate depolymerase
MKLNIVCAFFTLLILSACASSQHLEKFAYGEHGFKRDSIVSDGIQRTFLFNVPAQNNDTSEIPLFIFLHAFQHTGQTTLAMDIYSLKQKLKRDTAAVVFPDAIGRHWNDKMGGSYPASDTVNDIGFISRLIDHFIKDYKCDPARVYLIGVSNGGFLSYRMSCEMPEKITAICTIISSMGEKALNEFTKVPPMPVMIINGTADNIVSWAGGKVGRSSAPLAVAAPVQDNINYWRMRNGITSAADTTLLPDYCAGDDSKVIEYRFQGKSDLLFYEVINGGHNVPFKSKDSYGKHQNCDWDALGAAWDFLLSKRK